MNEIHCLNLQTRSSDLGAGFPFLHYAIMSRVPYVVKIGKEGISQEDLLTIYQPPSQMLQRWIQLY